MKICSAQCGRIKKKNSDASSKSPLAFYYRQTNNHADADTLDDKIENGIYFINNSKFYRRGQVLRKPDKAGDPLLWWKRTK